MATYRITLLVEWNHGGEPRLPMAPVQVHRGLDGRWVMDFDAEGSSFDHAAGRLWGEAAACGLDVRVVVPAQPMV